MSQALAATDPKEMVKAYWALIKRHPTSKYAPVAWLQLGEHFFPLGKKHQAIKSYKKAQETRQPLIYSIATLRLATLDVDRLHLNQARRDCVALLAEENCWPEALVDSWRQICSAQYGE